MILVSLQPVEDLWYVNPWIQVYTAWCTSMVALYTIWWTVMVALYTALCTCMQWHNTFPDLSAWPQCTLSNILRAKLKRNLPGIPNQTWPRNRVSSLKSGFEFRETLETQNVTGQYLKMKPLYRSRVTAGKVSFVVIVEHMKHHFFIFML